MDIKRLFAGETDNTLIQLFRYCFVGGLAFAVDAGSLVVFKEAFEMNTNLAAVISFVLGLSINYLLSTCWIFKNSKLSSRLAEFAAFAVIGVIGLLMNVAIIWFFEDFLGPKKPLGNLMPQSKYYIAGKLVSTVIVFVWNFFARKFIIFDKNKA
ncbi:GtrA family protein [Ruminococcus sp. Marseille-P6503]|uniref:GtrA family protein n=1 Tax=Ruminococcus sp. Marseille-P6503 TaxID=2364796 RepID=UPI000F52BFE9|nr:GtrA family protein [Ruminococcus sp. Marseille-P6503]